MVDLALVAEIYLTLFTVWLGVEAIIETFVSTTTVAHFNSDKIIILDIIADLEIIHAILDVLRVCL